MGDSGAARRRRGVTLEAVAERAGVSIKTASNAVNGTGRMSPETRARVLAVVDALGYKVNVAARNLMRGRTGAVTLAVPRLKHAYLAHLADAVIEEAHARALELYVTIYPELAEGGAASFLRQFNPRLSDGLLLSLPEDEALTAEALDVDFPLVCLGSRPTYGRADRVTTHDVTDARTAAEFLYARGVTSLAVVGAYVPYDRTAIAAASEGNAAQRLRGVLEAAVAAGRPLDPHLVGVSGFDWTIGGGFRTTRALLATGIPFDGLVCLNDGLAIGAISALRESGRRVPEDVQVIGFDNIEESAFLVPPLTTMDSRIDWIAPTALDRLIARIDQSAEPPAELLAQSSVIERGTTR
ncbi:LacI family DNA-binding transcriptional regulator [Demequina soli]|uniref:LacI family DNA-binding transcriptional regulator n=1 Tax=Demequina soli TaxID=1638987 RepID=UPI000781DE7F|nr:LacI family DNA-binding transcriptional regulator [Demequina soli]